MKSSGKSLKVLDVLGKTWMIMIKSHPREASLISFFIVGSSMLAGFITYMWKLFYDSINNFINGSKNTKAILISFIFLAVGYLVQKLFIIISDIYKPKFIEEIKFSLLSKIHKQVDMIPMEYYEEPSLYNTIHRANETVSSGKFMNFFLNSFSVVGEFITVLSVSIVLATFNPWLILLCLISVIPPFAARVIKGTKYYYMKMYQTPKIRMQNYLWSLLTSRESLKEVRVFGSGEYLKERWSNCKRELQEEEWSFIKKNGWFQFLVDTSRILGLGIGISLLVILMTKNAIKVGEFAAGIAAFQTVQESFSGFLIQISLASEKVPFLADLFKFLDIPTADTEEKMEYGGLSKGIELEDASFSYSGSEKIVLNEINLEIKKGETIALIGHNGAGKTTLAKLILGLYKPTKGKIKYDDTELSKYNLKSIYAHASAVFQDYTKFLLTFRENIGLGDIDNINNDNRIMKVVNENELNNVLTKLPDGLDSQLGREFGGAELSGGEWQKIAIGRGMLRNGDIIVLDEPTASLDPILEANVFKKFKEVSKGKTTILISHRVGSARIADRIIVLDNGAILEEGAHDELMARKGKYYELFNMQAQWYQ